MQTTQPMQSTDGFSIILVTKSYVKLKLMQATDGCSSMGLVRHDSCVWQGMAHAGAARRQ
jgi:hypothetical protein